MSDDDADMTHGRHTPAESMTEHFQVCASSLGDISRMFGRELTEQVVVPHLLTLSQDSVWGVRKACAEVYTDVSNNCSMTIRRNHLAPKFIMLLADPSRWVCAYSQNFSSRKKKSENKANCFESRFFRKRFFLSIYFINIRTKKARTINILGKTRYFSPKSKHIFAKHGALHDFFFLAKKF